MLVRSGFRAPEAVAGAADIPVAEVVHKRLNGARCIREMIIFHLVAHAISEGVETRQDPPVYRGAF